MQLASPVSTMTSYTSGGTAQRIQASAVVTYQGPDSSDNARRTTYCNSCCKYQEWFCS